jgi:class 3 adenylate cyclase
MGWKITLTNIERKQKSERTFKQSEVRFGRDPGCDVVVDHPRVSRQHFVLSNVDGHCFLKDSSRNGVLLKLRDRWCKVQGEIGLLPPVQLLLPDWAIEAEVVKEARQEETQVWDQSVIIPAGRLAQRAEAILVFDLCQSSAIASQDDHMAYHMKRRLNQIAEPLLEEFHRRFFKSTGDGFLATFANCQDALAASLELESRIQQRNQRTTNPPIHYRLALHFGETWAITSGGEDIHGHDVNVTFRIEGVQLTGFAEPKRRFPIQDRILCSAAFLQTLDKTPAARGDTPFLHCGAASLKGINTPVDIYWIVTEYSDNLEETRAGSVDFLISD